MKKIISFLMALILCMAFMIPAFAANRTVFGTLEVAGQGTETAPYKITDIDKLRALAYEVNEGNFDFEGKYFALYTSLTGSLETPIGTPDNPFRGNFNGCGNMVTLNINMPNDDYVGMFGYCESSRIENLDWQGSVIGHSYVGGICGFCDGGSIINCGDIMGISLEKEISGHCYVGGICGEMDNGMIDRCINNVSILRCQPTNLGGICGQMITGEIKNCVNNGDLEGNFVGGICGTIATIDFPNPYSSFINCVNNGNIGISSCGGLVGYTGYTDFSNSISTGSVLLGQQVGGFAALITTDISYINVFYDVTIADMVGTSWDNWIFEHNVSVKARIHTTEAEASYSTGARTTEQMKSEEILNTLNEFVDENPDLGLLHWETGASGYPCLVFPTNGTGSTFSEGSVWVVAGIGAVAVVAVSVIMAKKKKKAAVTVAAETEETAETEEE